MATSRMVLIRVQRYGGAGWRAAAAEMQGWRGYVGSL